MLKYCSKRIREQDGLTYFTNIFKSEMQVRMCTSDTIYKIDVREAKENEDTPYYGWLEPNGDISLIFPSMILLEVCFPYGTKAKEQRGRGKVIKVTITEVQDVPT